MVDTLILTALCACIVYAVVLHLRLRRLKDALEGLRPALEGFSAAAERTEGSVQSLRFVADHISAGARRKAGGWWTGTERGETAAEGLRHVSTVRVPAKQDLIRSFFETARRSQV
ncbi:hypothetical protein [Roseicyclus sediminis]|uniref:hypothetical protein n=1 Tax=Roseicyclus sediminis TaxID=2980997 RepID=UPI0021D272F3|nr:hypothetical protein [Roseibacterium sp. SDUM158016]